MRVFKFGFLTLIALLLSGCMPAALDGWQVSDPPEFTQPSERPKRDIWYDLPPETPVSQDNNIQKNKPQENQNEKTSKSTGEIAEISTIAGDEQHSEEGTQAPASEATSDTQLDTPATKDVSEKVAPASRLVVPTEKKPKPLINRSRRQPTVRANTTRGRLQGAPAKSLKTIKPPLQTPVPPKAPTSEPLPPAVTPSAPPLDLPPE